MEAKMSNMGKGNQILETRNMNQFYIIQKRDSLKLSKHKKIQNVQFKKFNEDTMGKLYKKDSQSV